MTHRSKEITIGSFISNERFVNARLFVWDVEFLHFSILSARTHPSGIPGLRDLLTYLINLRALGSPLKFPEPPAGKVSSQARLLRNCCHDFGRRRAIPIQSVNEESASSWRQARSVAAAN